MREEEIRKREYLNPIFYNEIDQINYLYLITNKAEELGKMDTGFYYMFKTKRNDELKKAYQLQYFPEFNAPFGQDVRGKLG